MQDTCTVIPVDEVCVGLQLSGVHISECKGKAMVHLMSERVWRQVQGRKAQLGILCWTFQKHTSLMVISRLLIVFDVEACNLLHTHIHISLMFCCRLFSSFCLYGPLHTLSHTFRSWFTLFSLLDLRAHFLLFSRYFRSLVFKGFLLEKQHTVWDDKVVSSEKLK